MRKHPSPLIDRNLVAMVETALREHPGVANATVAISQRERFTAYVLPKDEYLDKLPGRTATEESLLQRWRKTYDLTQLGTSAKSSSAGFNIAGWNSSYTRKPLSPQEMKEWVDVTVREILSLHPTEVLEIGCGTGLLLQRIAQSCRRYVGIDFAPLVLDGLRKQLRDSPITSCNVELLERRAEKLEDLPDQSFDTVIINSVVQYFPSLAYLTKVLDNAIRVVKTDGKIFVGDIRSLSLQNLFWLSVELFQAGVGSAPMDLKQRVLHRVQQDPQLVLSPSYFTSLQKRHPRVGAVQIQLKKTRFDNEMTRYRFDVILHVNSSRPPIIEPDWIDFFPDWNIDNFRRLLIPGKDCIGIRGIKNAWLAADNWALSQLSESTMRSEQLPSGKIAAQGGIHPADLYSLAAELGYAVELSWASSRDDGSFEAVFSRNSRPGFVKWPEPVGLSRLQFANFPGESDIRKRFVEDIMAHGRNSLGQSMLLESIVLVDDLPKDPW